MLLPSELEDDDDEAVTDECEWLDPFELLDAEAVVLPSSATKRSLTVPSACSVTS